VLRRLAAPIAPLAALALAGRLAAQSAPQLTAVTVGVSQTLARGSCADEAVRVRGRIHLVLHSPSPPTATAKDVLVDLKGVEGVGQSSGAGYRFANTGRDRLRLPCTPAGPCMPDVLGEFTLAGTGPNADLRGRFVVRLMTTPNGNVLGRLSGVHFTCPQE
jgi:hypothetical protein